MAAPIRVFIVAEELLDRFALTQLLSSESDIRIVGSHAILPGLNGVIERSGADVLLLDVPVARAERLRSLRYVRQLHLPTVVFTTSDEGMARDILPMLEAGAAGFVLKPEGEDSLSLVRDQLLHEIRANRGGVPPAHRPRAVGPRHTPDRIIAIGSSTGGPEALAAILPQFPADLKAGVVIVQHMPGQFTGHFAERLSRLAQIPVKEAEEGDVIQGGSVLLARGDFHLVFHAVESGGRVQAKASLTLDPPQWKLRPTVDRMMASLAPIFQSSMVGVILTGMGQDGVVGMREVKKYGGATLAQDKASSVVYGMAQEVVRNHLADQVLPLMSIVPELVRMTEGI